MKKVIKLLLVLCFGIILSSCGSSNTDPVDNLKSYQLYPDGYFSTGFVEEYNLTGKDGAGNIFATGTRLELTGKLTTFNSQTVAPVNIQTDWTNTTTGDNVTASIISNYSTGGGLQLIAEENVLMGITGIGINLATIPTTAKIGDKGLIGSYPDNIGNTTEISWRLDAEGDFAKYTIDAVTKDSNGVSLLEGNVGYIIDEAGNRQSLTVYANFIFLGGIIHNWTGVKL